MDIYATSFENRLDDRLFLHLLHLTGENKREKILRYRQWEDAHRALLGDLLIRSVLIRKTGLRKDELSLSHDSNQKPLLRGKPSIHFSLSHSGSYAICAVDCMPVGVDIEKIKDIDLDVAEICLSTSERAELARRAKSERLHFFYSLWTLKESYAKAVGEGLSLPFESFSIQSLPEGHFRLKSGERECRDVYFKTYHSFYGYEIAACAFHNDFPVKIIYKDIKDIITAFQQEEDHGKKREG